MYQALTDIFSERSFDDPAVMRESYFIPVPKDEEDLLDDDLDLGFESGNEDDDLYEDIFNEPEEPNPDALVDEGQLLLMVRGLQKLYKQGGRTLTVLGNVDLRLYSGEICALVGPSGSGKSTLLHILGLLDSPTGGQILIGDQDVSKLRDRIRTKLRSQHIGFVYQFHHLLPEFTALENVALPQVIAGIPFPQANEKAAELLTQLGLSNRLNHRPATMSGGEQQRVAIARALINDPYLLFADEPTGNLDPETSGEVFSLLIDVVRKRGIGALIATHNMDLAHQMDRILEVKSGHVLPY